MAGSYNHLVNDDGHFTFDLIENMGDAREALAQCFFLIHYLVGGGNQTLIEAAINEYYKCCRGEPVNTTAAFVFQTLLHGNQFGIEG